MTHTEIPAAAVSLRRNDPDPTFVAWVERIGVAFAATALMISVTLPIGWAFGVAILRPTNPTTTPAHIIAVVAILTIQLATIGLHLRPNQRPFTPVLALLLIALLETIVEYITPGELFFAPAIRFLDPYLNADKIPPNSAMCMVLLCLALLTITSRRMWLRRVARIAAGLTIVIAALAIIGHIYTVQSFYMLSIPFSTVAPADDQTYNAMSLVGAIGFILTGSSIHTLTPQEGFIRLMTSRGPAGVMTRRLYAAAVTVPPALGLLGILTSVVWQWYDIPTAVAMLALLSVFLFVLVISATSSGIERADRSREEAEEALRLSREQLRELGGHIQVLQEEERLRIAREVHDELGQSLTALKMDVALLRGSLPAHSNGAATGTSAKDGGHGLPSDVDARDQMTKEVDRRTASMLSLVNATIRSVQRISSELRPSVLDDLGLSAAMEWHARDFEDRFGLSVDLTLPEQETRATRPQRTALFRIFQETLTNIARHAKAESVSVMLSETGDILSMIIQDDGVGLDPNLINERGSLGLIGMRERALLAGGTFSLSSVPGEGTRTTVMLTLEPSRAGASTFETPDLRTNLTNELTATGQRS